jgi:hypothetical protein
VSRLSHALLAALALHGLLLLVRTRHVPPGSPPATSTAVEQLVELEEPAVSDSTREVSPSTDTPAARTAPTPAAFHGSSHASAVETASADPAGADPTANGGLTPDAAPATSAEASVGAPPRKIDLGLSDGFFMRPPSEQFPRVRKSGVQRQLEASLSADDVRHGLARGNALLGSLNAAVRDAGPVRGEALLRVTVGSDGSFSDVEFLQGAVSDWASALSLFRELAMRKRVRVPPGARGLRVTFAVKAKVQLPSGTEVKGVDTAKPSLDPNGLTLHGTFDVADTGASAQRLVYARVVSEEVL